MSAPVDITKPMFDIQKNTGLENGYMKSNPFEPVDITKPMFDIFATKDSDKKDCIQMFTCDISDLFDLDRNQVINESEKLIKETLGQDFAQKSAEGKQESIQKIYAILKRECEELELKNTRLKSKAQMRSQKKIHAYAKGQASNFHKKSYASLIQSASALIVGVAVLSLFDANNLQQGKVTQEMLMGIVNQLGGAAINYYDGENVPLQNKAQIEQVKYGEKNNNASETGKNDRGRLLESILQGALSAIRS